MDPKDVKRFELAMNFAFEEYCEKEGITSHDYIEIIQPAFYAGYLAALQTKDK